MRKRKRTASFELALDVTDDGFIRPPHDAQRNWLLNRFLREASDDLHALDWVARRFVAGAHDDRPADLRNADLSDNEIMEAWQLPLIEALAALVAGRGGSVAEGR